MAKLDADEKQILAAALLAMFSECPAEVVSEIGPAFAAIARKLGLGEAFSAIAEQAKAASEAAETGK